jgi:hypothetical protein
VCHQQPALPAIFFPKISISLILHLLQSSVQRSPSQIDLWFLKLLNPTHFFHMYIFFLPYSLPLTNCTIYLFI